MEYLSKIFALSLLCVSTTIYPMHFNLPKIARTASIIQKRHLTNSHMYGDIKHYIDRQSHDTKKNCYVEFINEINNAYNAHDTIKLQNLVDKHAQRMIEHIYLRPDYNDVIANEKAKIVESTRACISAFILLSKKESSLPNDSTKISSQLPIQIGQESSTIDK